MLKRLCLIVVVLLAAPSFAAGHEADFSVQTYLEQPELFQIATLSGAMAVVQHVAMAGAAKSWDCACFQRWPVHEDVLAIFANYVRENPHILSEPFAPTLLEALRDRCRQFP